MKNKLSKQKIIIVYIRGTFKLKPLIKKINIGSKKPILSLWMRNKIFICN